MSIHKSIYLANGHYTVDRAMAVLKESSESFKSLGDNIVVDFSNVDKIDSAFIAITLEWIRLGIRENKVISFRGFTNSMVSLIEVYGLSKEIRGESMEQFTQPKVT